MLSGKIVSHKRLPHRKWSMICIYAHMMANLLNEVSLTDDRDLSYMLQASTIGKPNNTSSPRDNTELSEP